MDTAYYPPSSSLLSDSPISLFPSPTASQAAFLAMREGANNHHLSVIQSVLNSDPIKELAAAKTSSPLQSAEAINRNDFPSLQEVRTPIRIQQQADLVVNTSSSSPCSPQSTNFTTAGSSSSQKGMELMHLSPPLMEKLEADLVLLQKKYGLVSQVLTPARNPHQEASLGLADLISYKQAAMGTFASPPRQNTVKSSMALRTEVPFALNGMNSSSPFHSPPHRSSTDAQATNCAPPVRGNSPISSKSQSYTCKESVQSHGSSPAPICADSVLESAQHNQSLEVLGSAQHLPTIQFFNSTAATGGNASPNTQSSTCTVPVRGFTPPTAQIGADSVLGKAPFSAQCTETAPESTSAAHYPPTLVAEPVRRNTPPTLQSCADYASGNTPIAPLHNASSQNTEPARGTSWAARLGGSRSTSATALSYFPPTVIAGHSGASRTISAKIEQKGQKWHFHELLPKSVPGQTFSTFAASSHPSTASEPFRRNSESRSTSGPLAREPRQFSAVLGLGLGQRALARSRA